MGKIKTLIESELVGGIQDTSVYPITAVKAVYDESNRNLKDVLGNNLPINLSVHYSSSSTPVMYTLAEAIAQVPTDDRRIGFTGTYLSNAGWRQIQFNGDTITEWSDTSLWKDLSSSSEVDFYNVTVRVPLPSGNYYTAVQARAAVPLDSRKQGLVITYATGSASWSSEQFYKGDVEDWVLSSNWKTYGASTSVSGDFVVNGTNSSTVNIITDTNNVNIGSNTGNVNVDTSGNINSGSSITTANTVKGKQVNITGTETGVAIKAESGDVNLTTVTGTVKANGKEIATSEALTTHINNTQPHVIRVLESEWNANPLLYYNGVFRIDTANDSTDSSYIVVSNIQYSSASPAGYATYQTKFQNGIIYFRNRAKGATTFSNWTALETGTQVTIDNNVNSTSSSNAASPNLVNLKIDQHAGNEDIHIITSGTDKDSIISSGIYKLEYQTGSDIDASHLFVDKIVSGTTTTIRQIWFSTAVQIRTGTLNTTTSVVTWGTWTSLSPSIVESFTGLSTDVPSVKFLANCINNGYHFYNVTYSVPLSSGYYNATTARAAVPASVRKTGLYITYCTAANDWTIEQYTPASTATSDWNNTANWVGIEGGSGGGTILNVDTLSPLPSGTYYTLETATAAITSNLRALGSIITFNDGLGTWKSYQFIATELNNANWLAASSWTEYGTVSKGVVKTVTFNGTVYEPDDNGNLGLPDINTEIDETLTPTGTNPVQGGAIYQAINNIEAGVSLELNSVEENGEVVAYSISLLDKDGEVMSTTETFSGGGGGGETAGTKVVLTKITTNPTVKLGDTVNLSYTYDHIETSSNSSTGLQGASTITIVRGANTTTLPTTNISAGSTQTLNITDYVGVGTNTVKVRVVVDTGDTTQVSTISWNVTVVSLSLSSSFNVATIINQGDTVSIPYSLSGSGNKVLRMYLDGVDTEDRTITASTSSGSFAINTTGKSHGSHSVQLVVDLTLDNGTVIKSNSIYFDIGIRVSGNLTPVVSTRFDYSDGTIIAAGARPYINTKQYDSFTLVYAAYNPSEVPATVSIISDGTTLSTLKVSFVRTEFSYRYLSAGTKVCSINVGSTVYTYNTVVSITDLDIEEPTDNMTLYLSAMGRSNSDVNMETWTYGGVSTTFTNFKWGGDGWLNDALRFTGTARATINYKPLQAPTQNVTNAFVFSIRIKVSNVTDDTSEVVSCIDSNGTGFKITTQEASMVARGNSSVAMKFATDTIYNIAFVSYPTSSFDSSEDQVINSNMLHLYIDGVLSGSIQRGSGESIYQATPQNITLGSADATLDVYSMRAYSAELNDNQMLDLYMIDLGDADELVEKYNNNNILDDNGIIAVDSLNDDIPYIIITGKQDNGVETFLQAAVNNNKDPKYDVTSMLFVNKSAPEKNFYLSGGCIRLQGTSSMAYPRKNYRIYLQNKSKVDGQLYLGCDEQGVGGTLQDTALYSFRDATSTKKAAAPVNCFCFKADYAESSSSHNTGMATMINDVLVAASEKTPVQAHVSPDYNYDVRTTIDGFPCLVFYRGTETDTPIFAGKFNFNNDKSTEAVFGFKSIPGYHDQAWVTDKFAGVNPTQCWEFLNNDYDMGKFKNVDFDAVEANGTASWKLVWEGRFPDGGTNTTYLRPLAEWIASTDTTISGLTSAQITARQTKFVNEVSNYFDVDYLCDYYISNDITAGVDQRVKNMMWAFFYDPDVDKVLCYPIYYDCDTIWGLRNDGRLKYNWDVNENTLDPELTASSGTNVYAFAGHDSVIWKNVRDLLSTKLSSAYTKLRNQMSNALLYKYFDDNQSAKFSERIFNKDALYKYISPKTKGISVVENDVTIVKTYSYLEDLQGSRTSHRHWYITNRLDLFDARYNAGNYKSTDLNWKGYSNSGAKVYVTPSRDYYFGFVADATSVHQAVSANVEWSYTYNQAANIGTIIHFYGGKYASAINLSEWGGFTSINIPTLPVLETLILGKTGNTYSGITSLSIDTNIPLLKYLDVTGYSALTTLDLSSCTLLENVQASACTSLSTITFGEGSPLSTLRLPNGYQVLKLISLPSLAISGITFDNKYTITSLWVENCALINGITLLNTIKDSTSSALKYIRIVDVNLTGDGTDLISWYNANLGGIDSNGNNLTDKCKITGTYTLTQLLEDSVYTNLTARFDELNIIQPEFTTIIVNDNTISTEKFSNIDNSTGYDYGNTFVASGHVSIILNLRHAYLVKYRGSGAFAACQLSDSNNYYFFNGTTTASLSGSMGDICMFEPHYWYKGVNDSKNGLRYMLYSSNTTKPTSAVGTKFLSTEVTTTTGYAVSTSDVYSNISSALVSNSSYNTCMLNLPTDKTYKQLRVLGVPSASYGMVFTDASGNILQRTYATSAKGMFLNSYIYNTIPTGATKAYFTISSSTYGITIPYYAYITTSSDVEAIEPDWVEHKPTFIGRLLGDYRDGAVVSYLTTSYSTELSELSLSVYRSGALGRGAGYDLCDYDEWKNVMNLAYMKYGTTNLYQKIGGSVSSTGSPYNVSNMFAGTDLFTFGITDTVATYQSTSSTYGNYGATITSGGTTYWTLINCMMGYIDGGPYGVWKAKKSYADSITTRASTYWTINLGRSGRTLFVPTSTIYNSYIYNPTIQGGRYLDVLPAYDNTSGSTSTYYCAINAWMNTTYTTPGSFGFGHSSIFLAASGGTSSLAIIAAPNSDSLIHNGSNYHEGIGRIMIVPTTYTIYTNPITFINL